MERAWLERELEAGRSIESIAREVDRDPSTVGYWARKHGLVSLHMSKHASRGGVDRSMLTALVGEGLSSYAIAERLGLSQSTVRHWLKRWDLRTVQANRRHQDAVPNGDGAFTSTCHRHGVTRFVPRDDGGGRRCLACRSEAVATRRRKVKAILVAEAGGRCVLCGYSRCVTALHFHHLDRSGKEFHLSFGGHTRSLSRMRAEAGKCALLCANCHAEVETGVATIPAKLPRRPPVPR